MPLAIEMVSQDRFLFQSLIDFGGHYIYMDNHDDNEYNRICSTNMDQTMRKYITKMGTMFISFLFAVFGPIYVFIAHGQKASTTQTHIPYTEVGSNAEFTGNMVLQNVTAGHGIFMYIGFELFFSLLEDVVTVSPLLIQSKLKYTTQLLQEKSMSKLELWWRFGQVVNAAQDLDR